MEMEMSTRMLPEPMPEALPQAAVAASMSTLILSTITFTLSGVALAAVREAESGCQRDLRLQDGYELTELSGRGREVLVQLGEDIRDGRSYRGVAGHERASLGGGNGSRSRDGRRESAERESGEGSDLHEREHVAWRGARRGR